MIETIATAALAVNENLKIQKLNQMEKLKIQKLKKIQKKMSLNIQKMILN